MAVTKALSDPRFIVHGVLKQIKRGERKTSSCNHQPIGIEKILERSSHHLEVCAYAYGYMYEVREWT